MEFRVLGPLEVRERDGQLPVSGAKQRALLAMLLLHANQVVPVERLIDELWGERPPETAAKSLQIYVSRLRKALRVNGHGAEAAAGGSDELIGGDVVLTCPGGYMLRVGAGELDLERFKSLLDAGEAALRQGGAATAAARLSDGLALWRGPALSDVELASVGRAEIGRLDELHLRAQEQRIEAELALGRHADVIGELGGLIAEHPLRERLRGQLMLALYRCGRQAEALEAYRQARHTLVEQLGLEPGRALKELEQAILQQDAALDAPDTGGVSPARAPPARQGRRRTVAVIAVGVVAIAAAVLVATRGSGGRSVAEPNSVAVIDVRSNRLVDQVPVGISPGDVSAGAGSLWVANTGDATVSRIDERTRRVDATIAPGTAVDGMAAGAGAVWASDSRRGLTVRIDPNLRRVDRSIKVGGGGAYWSGPVAVATGAGSVWAGTQADLVVRIDPARRTVRARIGVGNQPSAIAVGEGAVWVADGFDNTVTRIDPATDSVVATIHVGHGVGGIAAGAGGVWVADTVDDAVARIDPDTDSVTGTIPVGTAPNGVAVGAGAVWVANGGSGTVSRLDPRTRRVTATIRLGQSPQALALADGALWVTVQRSPPKPPATTAARDPATARLLLDVDQATDPAIAPISSIGYATGALLLNYPDRPFPAGARLQPEVARAMPEVTDGGRTYIYHLRKGFRFSPPSNRPVTAAAFKRAIERALSPRTRSYAAVLVDDIAGLGAYRSGRARSIAGVIANGDTLTIRLTHPSATLPARLAMPYFSAVPTDTPIDPDGIVGIPSAGPYYVASTNRGGELVLKRNPNYAGDRPHRLRELDISAGPTQPNAIAQVQAGQADAVAVTPGDGGAAAKRRLQGRYGPLSPAARAGQQRYFSTPTEALHYLALNTRRPLFSRVRLRQAVNYAIDRRALAAQVPPSAFGQPTDQYIPPGMRGFRDATIYPLGGPDVAAARRLAGHRDRHAVLYTCELPACQHNAAVVRQNLRAIGLHVEIRQFSYDTLDRRLGRAGEPWDIATVGWSADYSDPADIMNPILGEVGPAPIPIGSINFGRFANPRFQRRLHAVDGLTGARRYRAYARLDANLARDAAPLAAYASQTTDYFFSARIGCQNMQPIYGIDLAALCVRP